MTKTPHKKAPEGKTAPLTQRKTLADKVQSVVTKEATKNWSRGALHLIGTTTADANEIPYVYSIGMPKFCQTGEIAMAGMSFKQMMNLLNNTHKCVADGKIELKDGGVIPAGVIANIGFKIYEIPNPHAYCCQALLSNIAVANLVELKGFGKVFQILWPDKDGSFEHTRQYVMR